MSNIFYKYDTAKKIVEKMEEDICLSSNICNSLGFINILYPNLVLRICEDEDDNDDIDEQVKQIAHKYNFEYKKSQIQVPESGDSDKCFIIFFNGIQQYKINKLDSPKKIEDLLYNIVYPGIFSCSSSTYAKDDRE